MIQHRIIEPLFFAAGDVTKGEDPEKAYSKISIIPLEINGVVISINGVSDNPFYEVSRDGQAVTASKTILSDFHVIKADYFVEIENELAAPLIALSEKMAEVTALFSQFVTQVADNSGTLLRIAGAVETLQQQGDITVQVEAQKEQESLTLLEQLIAENNIQDAELQPDEATFSEESAALIAQAKALQGITSDGGADDAGIDYEEGAPEEIFESGEETPSTEADEPPADFEEGDFGEGA